VKFGGAISPPRDALSAPSTLVRAEKLKVATPHQVQPGTDQADGPVAEVVCLPGRAGGHTALPEQSLRNRAIGFAGEARIKRAEDEHQSLAPRRREASRRAERLPGQGLPQTKRSVSAGREILIEGDDRGRGSRSRSTANEYDRSTVSRTSDDPVLAIACGMHEYLRQRTDTAGPAKFRGRGREKNDCRSKMRQPNRRGLVRALVRVEREIAVPSG
jgi:hypothetical protein